MGFLDREYSKPGVMPGHSYDCDCPMCCHVRGGLYKHPTAAKSAPPIPTMAWFCNTCNRYTEVVSKLVWFGFGKFKTVCSICGSKDIIYKEIQSDLPSKG